MSEANTLSVGKSRFGAALYLKSCVICGKTFQTLAKDGEYCGQYGRNGWGCKKKIARGRSTARRLLITAQSMEGQI
jgi:hypothetical protein